MTASVRLDAIDHHFGSFHALKDIKLDIEAGEYIALLGPSGCGKTTLLNVLGGFVEPMKGRVEIGDRDVTRVPPAKRPTTTVFQDYALFPHMSLRDNVAFGLRMAGMARRLRHEKARAALDLVGLADAAGKRPHELSGGQRQRVALARALAVDPEVLLLDEPLGALDLKLRRQMQDELKAIQKQVGTTFVHVTHDQDEAMAIADRIVVMNAGRIEDVGTPARVYRKPRTLFAAGFMGEMNRIPVEGKGDQLETPFGPLPRPASGAKVLCVRPEALCHKGEGFDLGFAAVQDAAFFGTHVRAHLTPAAAPDLTLVAHLSVREVPAPGVQIALRADPDDLLIFDAEAT
jgi:spermidine/putrescine transport system ATP-binding protein